LALKIAGKTVGVLPLARRYLPGDAVFTTLLMCAALTFGTVVALCSP
jgi:hypothetical protein